MNADRKIDGWAKYPFIFGQFSNFEYFAAEDKEDVKEAGVCTHENCGFGCTITVIDYDMMDQN